MMLPAPCSARVRTMPSPTLIPDGRTPSHFCGTVLPTARQTWYSLCKSNTRILNKTYCRELSCIDKASHREYLKRGSLIIWKIILSRTTFALLLIQTQSHREVSDLRIMYHEKKCIITKYTCTYSWLMILIFKRYCNTVKLITDIFRFAINWWNVFYKLDIYVCIFQFAFRW